jgi:hypothetical protein
MWSLQLCLIHMQMPFSRATCLIVQNQCLQFAYVDSEAYRALSSPNRLLTHGHGVKIWSVDWLDPRPRPRRRSTAWCGRPIPNVRPLTSDGGPQNASIHSVACPDSARKELLERPVVCGTGLNEAENHGRARNRMRNYPEFSVGVSMLHCRLGKRRRVFMLQLCQSVSSVRSDAQ